MIDKQTRIAAVNEFIVLVRREAMKIDDANLFEVADILDGYEDKSEAFDLVVEIFASNGIYLKGE